MLFARPLAQEEEDALYAMLEDEKVGYRARILLLSSGGYATMEIWKALNIHPVTVRKWIRLFNEEGLGRVARKSWPRNPKFSQEEREAVVAFAKKPPKEHGFGFTNWSLRSLQHTNRGGHRPQHQPRVHQADPA